MNILNKSITNQANRPIRVMQFGEGNFLRGFVDYMIDIANEKGQFDGSIVLIKPIPFGDLDKFHTQEYQYTVSLRGKVDGEEKVINRTITSISDAIDAYLEYDKYIDLAKVDTLRFVVSNTTEAGILFDETDSFDAKPAKTYPGKLTQFLYARYNVFNGEKDKGLIILPVELIDDNGVELKKCVMKFIDIWKLSASFKKWVEESCVFCSTLVDRIVTGYPKDEEESIWKTLGYQDNLLVTGEPFALWVIESEKEIKDELPLDKADLPVIFTDNQKPYKQRKVRILNGAHTSFVLASYLAGNDYVLESMHDKVIKKFMLDTIYNEVIPTLSLPEAELKEFARAVIDRFENPFIKHALLAISLNSVSKWRARCMPSFLGYIERKNGELPKHLTFSIASLICFYNGKEIIEGALIGNRDGVVYTIKDDKEVLEFFASNSSLNSFELAKAFLSKESFHGQDLSIINGLTEAVGNYIEEIRVDGMRKTLEHHFA